MAPRRQDAALIENALQAIEQAMARSDMASVSFHGPTTLGALLPDERDALERIETQVCREKPEETAIHFCLTSARSLLDVAQTLMMTEGQPSPRERERRWDSLVTHTKKAGRAAYRAALVLTDTKRAA
ncbi:MAG: hypothetical protein REJ24_16170 [Rhodocyclaceae bacterium]|nr:hypothetical protein [Pseudomonadota bacterium]MDQ7974109.1 hypothetical protein [Rhodocyclaceae bacterium]MDQ8002692.1 hypothetical protein [Pseudomonadota bacterium]MDQ8019695.1 hypothetical protein [Pseudomonadota bacterium]